MDRLDILRISKLSNLSFEENSLTAFEHDFTNILSFVEKITEVETSKINPLSHPLSLVNHMRDDLVESNETVDQMIRDDSLAKFESGFFVVPRVIDEK